MNPQERDRCSVGEKGEPDWQTQQPRRTHSADAHNHLKGGQGHDIQRVAQPKLVKARGGHWEAHGRLSPRKDRRLKSFGGSDDRSYVDG